MRFRLKPGRPEEPDGAVAGSATVQKIITDNLDSAYNLARWLVKDPTLAEDVVQEAMVRALRHFPSYRGGDARAWLMQIVRNVGYTALSARRREREISIPEGGADPDGGSPAPEMADPADGPEMLMTRQQDLQCLERRLSALPTELRECLVLKEFEDLSYKQIAEVTGVPVGTVMSRLWRARQALVVPGR
jgi:RNA polymerase sigma-70 factor (ECF subfamily)